MKKNKPEPQHTDGTHQSRAKLLLDLYWTFFKIGSITFGGGLAMLPILERELSEKRHWTTNEELLDYYAIGQSTPGVIAVNVSTFIGYKRAGIIGGIVGTAGIVTPSIIVITLIAQFISNFEEIVWVQKAMRGINVAVAALLTYAVFGFAKKTVKNWWSAVFYVGAFSAIFFFNVNSLIVIASAAAGGIIIGLCTGKIGKKSTKPEKAPAAETASEINPSETKAMKKAKTVEKTETSSSTEATGGEK